MIVQHNMRAMNANRSLSITTANQTKSTEKLSTGYKINRAADDAAGLAISEKMRSQVRGLDQASANAQDGISMVQTAEGALEQVHSMLQRMNELAVKASNGINTATDISKMSSEVSALNTEIGRINSTTKFNKMSLLAASTVKLHVGAEGTSTDQISVALAAASTGISSLTAASASGAIATVATAISAVSVQRAGLGAIQNRLEYTIKNLDNISENTQAAEAAIRDTNMAEEMVKYSNNNILAQAGQSMLAQANQANQGVLSLLG